jgi:YD repeat-containing protein
MKLFLRAILLSSIALNVYASNANLSNCVRGIDSTGNTLTGTFVYHRCMRCDTCSTINKCENVSGLVTDQEGNTRTYKGEWNGYGHITGMTDDGDRVELNRING